MVCSSFFFIIWIYYFNANTKVTYCNGLNNKVVLLSKAIEVQKEVQEVDISAFEAGFYLILLKNREKVIETAKFEKE